MMNEKEQAFLDFYKELCKEYGMCINTFFGETPSDIGTEVCETTPEGLEEHFKEIEKNTL